MPVEILKSSCTATRYMRLSGMSRCAAQLWEINMAHINYVEFHNFEVDCSEISGDATDISVIMQNSDVSILDLCESEFGHDQNTAERDELIAYLVELAGNHAVYDFEKIRHWIGDCEDFETLIDLMATVTATLYSVIRSRGRL